MFAEYEYANGLMFLRLDQGLAPLQCRGGCTLYRFPIDAMILAQAIFESSKSLK